MIIFSNSSFKMMARRSRQRLYATDPLNACYDTAIAILQQYIFGVSSRLRPLIANEEFDQLR